MKTKFAILLVIIAVQAKKSKRGYNLGWVPSHTQPIEYYGDFNLDVNLPIPSAAPLNHAPPLPIISNSIEKPVDEPQEYVPPQSIATAVIPQMPPPAIPVNAAAANVPISRGAVFLGSGALGVLHLGNGAYALGSGALGYSENRIQPRPSAKDPAVPPLPASPDLIPAAVPSNVPVSPPVVPAFGPHNVLPVDQNGYEYLPPNRVGFGAPNPLTPPRLKTTQSFATPSVQQSAPQQSFDFNFGSFHPGGGFL